MIVLFKPYPSHPAISYTLAFCNQHTLNNVASLWFFTMIDLFRNAPMCAVSSADQQGSEAEKVLSASPMMQVEGFFMALTNSNTDGRVVVHRQGTV